MKTVKKLMTVLMAAAICCMAFTGCSGSQNAPASGSEAASASGTEPQEKVYTVGICQLVQHEALDAATQGFVDTLTAKLGDRVQFNPQNASGDSATCATIVNQFVADDVDLIMANATPALQAAMASTGDIPIVATSVTDFATALESSDWTGKTGINVTGTADLAPLAEQAAIIKELLPEAKTVGILYCSAEPNSKYQATVIEGELEKLNLAYKEYTVADTSEISSVTAVATTEVDCIYIPTDNTIASATAAVNEIATVPIVAGEEGICKGCGIATLSISYYSIGCKAGEMAYEILVNGADPAGMEIEYAQELTKKYVAERCDAMSISVPEDYEAIKMEEES